MSQFAVLVNARGNGVGELQAAERWSLVHQWCEDRGIYVGRGRGEQFSTPRCRMG